MFTNIIRNVILENVEGFFGDTKDSEDKVFINEVYRAEFRDMFESINHFIRYCFCSEYVLNSEE